MIDAKNETLVALADVPPLLPKRRGGRPVSVSCVYRWSVGRGCRGIRLETTQVGGTRATSREAIQRFFDRLSQQSSANHPSTPLPSAKEMPNRRRDAIRGADRRCAAAGV